ncbi:MAG: carboxypeptidase-like regulatory domain-containing protein [Bacteroidia bacterium]|nr:carboxypeptidase-like regulatory domain-containing protein [Bacteroidia bacterium]
MNRFCGKLLPLFFLCFSLSAGQLFPQSIKGKILDAQSQQPIAFATVEVIGSSKGSLSNEFGEFEFSISNLKEIVGPGEKLKLRFASLGYGEAVQEVGLTDGDQVLNILLMPNPLTLGTVEILSVKLSPKELYRRCMSEISSNFPTNPYQLKSFYRHYCVENGTYGRLIEASVDIYDEKGFGRRYKSVAKKYNLRVSQLRKSLDFTEFSYFNHVPIALNRSIRHDYASFEVPYLSGMYIEQASFSFADTIFDSEGTILVVQAQTLWQGTHYTTDFYINLDLLALIKMEEHASRSFFNKDYRSLRRNHFVVRYKSYQGKYYLSHVINEGHVQSWRKDNESSFETQTDHTHKISWVVHDILTEGIQPWKGKEPGREELASIPFDEHFWNSYSPLLATPLEKRIRRDLSQRLQLEKQFKAGESLLGNKDLQRDLARKSYNKFLAEHGEQPILICFWESSNKPGPGELLTLRKLNKEFDQLPVELMWINLDKDREKMMKTIRRYGLYLGLHIHYPPMPDNAEVLGHKFKKSPYLLLYDKNGQQAYAGSKIPSYKKIKELLNNSR